MGHVRRMVELGPRPAGSAELTTAGDYIVGEIRNLGLEPHEDVWTEEGITFRNIWTQIPGQDPKRGPILAFGAHYDTKNTQGHPLPGQNFRFVGAIDGAGASGLLLELARVLGERQTPANPNIWLIWFDGEESIPFEWDDTRSLFGSRHFVRTMGEDKELFPGGLANRMKAFVLLDLIGASDIKIDRDGNSNKQLQDIFGRAADEMGEADRIYRYESGSRFTDDHIPFERYGVTVALLIDLSFRGAGQRSPDGIDYSQWWHTPRDTVDMMSPEALAFAGNLVWNALPLIEEEFFK
jgi:Zn-dependent M28 family amino/carboxypeptidase